MQIEIVRSIIAKSHWKFAKTMPHIPHYYTVRAKAASDDDFVRLVEFIRSHGYDERWGRYYHRYLDIDGWKYWTMGAQVESTAIVNREQLKRPPRPIALNPVPYVPSVDWHEVFCNKTKTFVPRHPELDLKKTDETP
jgi:hypothetical protein